MYDYRDEDRWRRGEGNQKIVNRIEVAAAVIEKDEKILITRRKPESHLGDYWEFPGGKRESGEDLPSCLIREIREELGIDVRIGVEVLAIDYDYPDRKVALHFFRCEWKGGDLRPEGCQEFKWVEKSSLNDHEFLPANVSILAFLKNQNSDTL
jgi:mutator protein MutT